MGSGLFQIAALFVGVAFAALLVGHSAGTAQVIDSATAGFGKLLATASLAGGYAGSSGISDSYSALTGNY